MLSAGDFFDLDDHPFEGLFKDTGYVWEALPRLKAFIKESLEPNVIDLRKNRIMVAETMVLYEGEAVTTGLEINSSGKKLVVKKDGSYLEGASIVYAGSFLMDDLIQIGKNVIIEPGALIKGPAVIGDGTEVRQGAYIRGDVLVGRNCVVGHTTEIKASIMLGGSKAGHFAYIGDSILGSVNLGAGTKLANLKMTDSPVVLNIKGQVYKTGLRKFGAILGDGVETGCNSVTAPGTLLGKKTLLYPGATARGYYPGQKIIKARQNQEVIDNLHDQ